MKHSILLILALIVIFCYQQKTIPGNLVSQKLEGDTLTQVWKLEYGWDKMHRHTSRMKLTQYVYAIIRGKKVLVRETILGDYMTK